MRYKVLVMKAKTKIAQRMSDGFEIKICAFQTYIKYKSKEKTIKKKSNCLK